MTELVHARRGEPPTQMSLAEIQERLDARKQVSEVSSGSPLTKKARTEEARKSFNRNPISTLQDIQIHADQLSQVFDESITVRSIPLSQTQVNRLSDELLYLEKLKLDLAAIEERYRSIVFAHLDETVTRVPGRPVSQTPGKVSSDAPGPHYVFERRGGGRGNPTLNTKTLREALAPDVASQLFVTVHHEAVAAWDEEVFDEARFLQLVDEGRIDLDVVSEHLIPGAWRTPSFYKTLVDDQHDG